MPAAIDPFKSFEAALPAIIAESPSQIMRYRETATDTFRGPQLFTAGPYTVRIEPFRQASVQDVFDEKGNVAGLLFQMVGYNLPRSLEEAGTVVPLFKLNDTVTDQDGNTYRVVAPQFVRGKVVWVTLELRG